MASPADLNDFKDGFSDAAASEIELKFNESLRDKTHQREASTNLTKDKKIKAKEDPDCPDLSPAQIET
jgi:hypothetical protein